MHGMRAAKKIHYWDSILGELVKAQYHDVGTGGEYGHVMARHMIQIDGLRRIAQENVA